MNKVTRFLDLALQLSRYNLKVVFANKFWFFVLASFLFFLLVVFITYFDSDVSPSVGTVYYMLMFPGLLLIFYPTVFGIQNDVDASMIEILFGIPNYSYKVWITRLALTWLIIFLMMIILAMLSSTRSCAQSSSWAHSRSCFRPSYVTATALLL